MAALREGTTLMVIGNVVQGRIDLPAVSVTSEIDVAESVVVGSIAEVA